jgi:ribosomal protein S27E
MSAQVITCPICGSQGLVLGEIVARAPGVKFKDSRGLLGDLTGDSITRGVLIHHATAMRCSQCNTVIVPGS